MSKRPLAVQNKISDDENRVVTRSNKKRVANFNENEENIENKRKKSRIDIENIDPKEDVKNPVAEEIPTEEEKSNLDESVETSIDRQEEDEKGEQHPTNKDYLIFGSRGTVVSKTAFYWTDRYVKMIPHVNPDYYGMYVHNDFSAYGELEIIENCLLELAKTVFVHQNILSRIRMEEKAKEKVNYVLGFRRLEALTYLLNQTDSIAGIDDGERFDAMLRLIGACYVTILRGLLPTEMFEKKPKENVELVEKLKKIEKKIPNFKQVLEQAMIIGRNYLTIGDICSAYTAIINVSFVFNRFPMFFFGR